VIFVVVPSASCKVSRMADGLPQTWREYLNLMLGPHGSNQVSYLSTGRLNSAEDKMALKELKRYMEYKPNLEKAKQKLAEAKPGTKEYECFKLACKTFELLLDWVNPRTIEKARVIHWIDEN